VGSTLSVADVGTGSVTVVAVAPADAHVGLADFVAAEEFNRTRGHWWSPDGTTLAFETVDDSALEEVWLFDPATPERPATSRRYPRAGGANPLVGLTIRRPDGSTVDVAWDKERFPYLVTASWPAHGPLPGPLITLMTRDQRDQVVAAVDGETGEITNLYEASDDSFLEWVDGLPTYAPEGRLVVGVVDRSCDTYRLATVTGATATPFTPEGLQVRDVVAVGETGLIVNASTDPRGLVTAEVSFDGSVNVIGDESARTRALAGASGVIAVTTSDAHDTSVAFLIRRSDASPLALRSLAWDPADAVPPVRPAPHFLEAGPLALSVAVLFPREMPEDGRRLPIILSPYGGPHHQRVVAALRAYALDQYLADQGYCVVVADGRGTGGRGPAWDRSVVARLGDAPVEDQVAALEAVCAAFGDRVDPGRVGVRGWSFGGYLAARCVLTRPDVFHAAVAGAPVTEWRWYDTGYTERYLGHPDEAPATYVACSLLPLAPRLERPLFFIHGYSDDNVLFCHTQMLSNALTEAGRSHRVVALSGVTHMAADPKVAESLLRMEVEFFNEALR
jgi:dipeptidyl-peptidase-4